VLSDFSHSLRMIRNAVRGDTVSAREVQPADVGAWWMTNLHVEIRVVGSVPTQVLEELGDVQLVSHSVETVLQGSLVDQAALIGIINLLQGLGVELREIRQWDAGSPALDGPGGGA
jgi:hypothetical protein